MKTQRESWAGRAAPVPPQGQEGGRVQQAGLVFGVCTQYKDRPKPGERPALGSRQPSSRRGRTPNLTKRTLSAGSLTNLRSKRKGEGHLAQQRVRGL